MTPGRKWRHLTQAVYPSMSLTSKSKMNNNVSRTVLGLFTFRFLNRWVIPFCGVVKRYLDKNKYRNVWADSWSPKVTFGIPYCLSLLHTSSPLVLLGRFTHWHNIYRTVSAYCSLLSKKIRYFMYCFYSSEFSSEQSDHYDVDFPISGRRLLCQCSGRKQRH